MFDTILEEAKENSDTNKMCFISPSHARQKDHTTCPIFVYKDLKEVLKDPSHIDNIIKQSSITLSAKSHSKLTEKTFNVPSIMCKLTQYIDQLEKLEQEGNITATTTLDYIKKGKLLANKSNTYIEEKKQNYPSTYWTDKYVYKTLPDMFYAKQPEEVFAIAESYKVEDLIGQIALVSE